MKFKVTVKCANKNKYYYFFTDELTIERDYHYAKTVRILKYKGTVEFNPNDRERLFFASLIVVDDRVIFDGMDERFLND